MQILLFRHGIAEDIGPDGTDASRRLTEEGVRKTTIIARGLTKFADSPNRIMTSPKQRAIQTAQLVGNAFGVQPEVTPLLGEENLQAIAGMLAKLPFHRVLIVGHEPTLSSLASWLCTGEINGFLGLKKAGCACIEWSNPTIPATLIWLATPKLLLAAASE